MIWTWFGRRMKLRDVIGEHIHQRAIEPRLLGKRIEQLRLIETPHHDNPIERRPVLDKVDLPFAARPIRRTFK